MYYEDILRRFEALKNPANVAGMARFGINPNNTYGISVVELRKIAREVKKDHTLAGQLWASGIHEARILASLVEERAAVTEEQLERWVSDFDSWDVCDQCCLNLFRWTPFAYAKAVEWSAREEEFVKRAGFVMMAALASGDKKASDEAFAAFLPIIRREAGDERNFVKKAVNWALRGIGKRSRHLNALAIETAEQIRQMDSKAARWVGADALRELTGAAVQARLK